MLLEIHFTKYYRFECEFYRALLSICHISNSFGEIFEKRIQFNTVEKLCFTIVTRNSLGSLHEASLEAKIVRICFLGVNTGLSE